MKIKKSIIYLICLFVLLAGCSSQTEKNDYDAETEARIAVLSGATGYGAVQLIDNSSNGTASMNYTISIESSPKVIQDSFIAGELDIAALPTNKAAMIASKTDNLIQVIAVNTLGVMYLVTNDGTTISSIADLKDTTVCIPEEPSYILKALLQAYGFSDEDVNVVTYATPSDLVASLIKGEINIAVLPEPLLSTAMSKKDNIQICLDLTQCFEELYPESDLMQGCLVVRTAWAEEHPKELAQFLLEYEASIHYVKENEEEASSLIESYFGIEASVAQKAISRCKMTFISGEEMKTKLQAFYDILIQIPSSNIGDDVPSDEFYYTGK